jgi:hypothetical protein
LNSAALEGFTAPVVGSKGEGEHMKTLHEALESRLSELEDSVNAMNVRVERTLSSRENVTNHKLLNIEMML